MTRCFVLVPVTGSAIGMAFCLLDNLYRITELLNEYQFVEHYLLGYALVSGLILKLFFFGPQPVAMDASLSK